MEIKSRIEEKVIQTKLLVIYINPKEKEVLVETLKGVLKKAKPDRFEEYVINGLIQALESPETIVLPQKEEPEILPEDVHEEQRKEEVIPHPDITVADKTRIVSEVKKRVDPQDKEHINDFIKSSVEFAKKNMGITTVPKSNSVEAFYDWMLASKIINPDGSPYHA